ncbi:heme-binding domain-containing protein [Sphingobacterium spiritivorum]|uniref:heme-binding domain-containing protein n=1 Tax=Sphingobacterium spiritivorum TaxID=258 RepID=UPI003DA4BB9A
MKTKGIVAGVITGIFVVLQFIPATPKNTREDNSFNFTTHFLPPENITSLLKTFCFDCHSNYTEYPWYTSIQPIEYMMSAHITEGKERLNFDEFITYRKRKKLTKFNSIIQVLEDGSMPLTSYSLIHGSLSKDERNKLISYFNELIIKEEKL